MLYSDYKTTLTHYTSLDVSDAAAALSRLDIGRDKETRPFDHQQKRQQSARQTVRFGASLRHGDAHDPAARQDRK